MADKRNRSEIKLVWTLLLIVLTSEGIFMKNGILFLFTGIFLYTFAGQTVVERNSVASQSFQKRGIASSEVQFKVKYSADAWGKLPKVTIPKGYFKIPGEDRQLAENNEVSVDDVFGNNSSIPKYDQFDNKSGRDSSTNSENQSDAEEINE